MRRRGTAITHRELGTAPGPIIDRRFCGAVWTVIHDYDFIGL
jgi:hypothetical protein